MASHEMGSQEMETCASAGDFEGLHAILARIGALPRREFKSLRQNSIVLEAARTAAEHGQTDCLMKIWQMQQAGSRDTAMTWTPLGEAVRAQHAECVRQVLLTAEGQASARGHSARVRGFTPAPPLTAAVSNGNLECVQLLIPFSDLNDVENAQSQTPLMIAVSNGHVDCAKALLDAGANVSLVDQEGRTLLMLAAGSPGDRQATALARLVLPYSNPVRRSVKSISAFEMALMAGNAQCASLLAPAIATIGVEYHPSGSELMHAVQLMANIECVKLALRLFPEQAQSQVNSQQKTPMTYILQAIAMPQQQGPTDMVSRLTACADALALHVGPKDLAAAIQSLGAEKLPQWKAHQERKQLDQALAAPSTTSPAPAPAVKAPPRIGRRI